MNETERDTPWVLEARRSIQKDMDENGLEGIRFFAMESKDISEDDIARGYCLFEDAIAAGKVRDVTETRL